MNSTHLDELEGGTTAVTEILGKLVELLLALFRVKFMAHLRPLSLSRESKIQSVCESKNSLSFLLPFLSYPALSSHKMEGVEKRRRAAQCLLLQNHGLGMGSCFYCIGTALSNSAHVTVGSGNIADPAKGIVLLVLQDAEVLDLQVGGIVHRNLKLQGDRSDLLAHRGGMRRRENDLGANGLFGAAHELLDAPLDRALLLVVLARLTLPNLRKK